MRIEEPAALLLSDESGASTVHRDAMRSHRGTVITRAFTGRPARALRNEFTDRFTNIAPLGYPALHQLTSPLRKAAVAAGHPEAVNLWAGTGYRRSTPGSAPDILARLAASTS